MPLLSIIVPVYNTTSFINDCLYSIVSQKFKDLEIICINDGSTDDSLDLLRKWEAEDDRIVIISQDNRGLSAARNIGLSLSKGKYVTFVDSDDKIHIKMYEDLVYLMESKSLDVIGCSFKTFPNGSTKYFESITDKIIGFDELLQSNQKIQSSNDLCFCWRYIIKKDIIKLNNIKFNENVRVGEDMIFIIETLSQSRKILLINDAYYFYRVNNNNSLMKSKQYNPNLALSLNLMYSIKKEQIRRFFINRYTPYSTDLAEYTILIYLPFMLKNEYANPNEPNKLEGVKRILSMPMIRDAMKEIGFRNIYPSWKEYMFYLAMKFKCTRLVHHLYFKRS